MSDERSPKWFQDIYDAINFIEKHTNELQLFDYEADEILRAAVERKLEIIGEAIRRLTHHDESAVACISEPEKIVGLRNILIHRYDTIEHRLVWQAIQISIPVLKGEVTALLLASSL